MPTAKSTATPEVDTPPKTPRRPKPRQRNRPRWSSPTISFARLPAATCRETPVRGAPVGRELVSRRPRADQRVRPGADPRSVLVDESGQGADARRARHQAVAAIDAPAEADDSAEATAEAEADLDRQAAARRVDPCSKADPGARKPGCCQTPNPWCARTARASRRPSRRSCSIGDCAALIDDLPEKDRATAKKLAAQLAEAISDSGAMPDPLPGWALFETGPGREPTKRRVRLKG